MGQVVGGLTSSGPDNLGGVPYNPDLPYLMEQLYMIVVVVKLVVDMTQIDYNRPKKVPNFKIS